MKLLYYPIAFLCFTTLITVLLGSDFMNVPIEYIYFRPFHNKWSSRTTVFEIDTIQYGLTFIVALLSLGCIVGLRILASGLADTSIRTLILIIFYIGIWTMLSVLSLDILLLNPTIGGVMYVFLCLIYVIGVSNQLTGGGGSD